MSDFNFPEGSTQTLDTDSEKKVPEEVYPGVDNRTQKRIRDNVNGSQDDPLAAYRYLGDEKLAQQMYDADQENKPEEPEIFGRIQDIIDELSDQEKTPVSSATQEAINYLTLGLRALRDRRINAVTQILKETGNDLAEVEKIREEEGAPTNVTELQ